MIFLFFFEEEEAYQRERESGIVGANSVRLERLMQETAELPLHKDTEAETESEKEGGSQRERERES